MPASTSPDNKQKFILNASCTAKSGIVAAVTTFLAENSCYICSLEQFDDESTQRFFMRAVFYVENPSYTVEALREGFTGVAESLGMSWKIHDPLLPVRTVIMVSRFDHCLDDLLYRRRKGDLNMEITAVVSNHSDLRAMAEREGIRFVHLPVTKENKAQQEDRLLEIVLETNSELVILARYMQILSNELSEKLSGSCINIHHSFLPGFKGAMPYHQAFERGVKQIGATAHYVTSDLDEGPIIEQVVTRVDHSFKADELARVGRDNECMALAAAVKSHIERRVFVDGNKTIVFHGS
ncbi:formyltetrahydrofolate deformylase [Pseudomonas aeruginosa]|uniref:formyltetrahydrofolate deformylase n=1 Tax=Pseudomonas aeruginosa TaxID=287 RepID=UPI0021E170B4|nr:formyltetrahydrofolate deformylase [Pseudomonas aeruginosa]MCV0280521.1 formyltetrahydrofolate deformylase [Pseudomonas aeruginosa]